MKYLNKIALVFIITLNTSVYAQMAIKNDTGKLLVPEVDSLEKFIKLNKIDYALITYSTSNWISIDYIFYAIIQKKKEYYLMRLANLDVFTKSPTLKVNQKKITTLEAQAYFKEIASVVAFKFSNQDYHELPESCTMINGADTVEERVVDAVTLHIFEHTKTSKKGIDAYNPSFYLEKCYPSNTEYVILKGFVNTYEKLTELVEKSFSNDPILPIQNRPRIK
ncbi:MAG: hypothetical protein WBP45_09805 [Daejeonella sp.]